ncbi:hypothetical protein TUM4249_30550 [Shewanella sp. KT0246]|nr:hypothetical protein TUM4249_30550 [Shewanella sp. KT0246]
MWGRIIGSNEILSTTFSFKKLSRGKNVRIVELLNALKAMNDEIDCLEYKIVYPFLWPSITTMVISNNIERKFIMHVSKVVQSFN